jgi:hypothetical protein
MTSRRETAAGGTGEFREDTPIELAPCGVASARHGKAALTGNAGRFGAADVPLAMNRTPEVTSRVRLAPSAEARALYARFGHLLHSPQARQRPRPYIRRARTLCAAQLSAAWRGPSSTSSIMFCWRAVAIAPFALRVILAARSLSPPPSSHGS